MEKIFVEILNMSISASFPVLAILLVRVFFRKMPSVVKCALWLMVGIRLIVPFNIESSLSLIPSSEVLPVESVMSDDPVIHTGISYVNSHVNPYIEETFSNPNAPSPMSVTRTAAIIYIAGVAAMAIFCAYSYIRLKLKVSQAIKVSDNVYKTEFIASPFVLGMIKPRIYMPFGISENEYSLTFFHEKAHIERGDHIVKPIAYLVLALHWFNPLIWLSYILLCRDIEIACDERVIKTLGSDIKAHYSKALLNANQKSSTLAVCPLAFGGTGVGQRIKNILSYKKPTVMVTAAAMIIAAILCVCFLTDPHTVPTDNSILNYSVFAQEAAKIDVMQAIYCPPQDGSNGFIQVGNIQGQAVQSFLNRVKWYERQKPSSLPSPNSVEFIIDDDTRITLYQKRVAKIRDGETERYYTIKKADYELAVKILKAASMTIKAEGKLVPTECIYNYPLSSMLYLPPYEWYYEINGDSMDKVYPDGARTSIGNITWDWQKADEDEIEDMIEPKLSTNPDLSKYDMSDLMVTHLNQSTRLYKVEDELWLLTTYSTPNGTKLAKEIFQLTAAD